jgi:Domain of unknown function (DUF4129)
VPAEYKKNIFPFLQNKRAWLFFLLFVPAVIHAQNDTVILADSLPHETILAPAEDPPPVEVSTDEVKTEYFREKWYSTADTTIQQRIVPDSINKKMQQDDDFWYANAEIKKEIKPGAPVYTPLGQRKWVQTLLWLVIIGGFAAAIMWWLAGSNIGLFRRKNKEIQNAGEEELITEDIFAINYQKEIDKAEDSGNYRLAIRLLFLRLLKEMAEKNIIRYKQDRTNLDYLMELYPTAYYNNFFRITRNYEYSWYGQFDVSEEGYRTIRNDFNQFNLQLK